MTTRTHANTVWDVISPCEYRLTGHPQVEAYYDGNFWYVRTLEHFKYKSLAEVSEWVADTFEQYPDLMEGEVS